MFFFFLRQAGKFNNTVLLEIIKNIEIKPEGQSVCLTQNKKQSFTVCTRLFKIKSYRNVGDDLTINYLKSL